ncbi:9040_t:CDS:1, partial [Scutellospora calospora]
MADPGNANTFRRDEPYGFQLPTPNINTFEESSEQASFAGGPIRHRKKRNHTNTPYTRVASSPNPNPQETSWLLGVIKKYIPQWLRTFIWPTAIPTTEATAMEIASTETETENIVQSSIEELNGAMKREEQPQLSQLDTITKMNLKSKFNRSSSRIAARFGRRMYSNPLHRRGTIPRKRFNHVSAREEDLLYPDEINEPLSDKEQCPEIPVDWYKPFKNLAVNDSFSTSSSGASTPSQEPDTSKKSLSQGPPLKKFKSDLVPDINWFNYHPTEKKEEKSASVPSSSILKNQNMPASDNLSKVPAISSLIPVSKPSDSEPYLSNNVEELSTTPLTQPKFIKIVDHSAKNDQYYSETKKMIDFSSLNGSVSTTSTPFISKDIPSISTTSTPFISKDTPSISTTSTPFISKDTSSISTTSTPFISKDTPSISTPVNKRPYDTVFNTPTTKPFGSESKIMTTNKIQGPSDLLPDTTTPKSIFGSGSKTQSSNLTSNKPFIGFNTKTLDLSNIPPKLFLFSVPNIDKEEKENKDRENKERMENKEESEEKEGKENKVEE